MLKWYIFRLKTMSFLEIPYRIKQLIQKKLESIFLVGKPYKINQIPVTDKILEIGTLNVEAYDDFFSIFGKKINFFDTTIDWHKDVFTGENFSKTFSKNISIRNNPNLSAKNVWEINRLQFLIHIAINYNTTKDKKYLDKFIELNNSWIDENPYLIGVNWYSNIEVNIRLINWFFCWEILDVESLMKESLEFREFVESKWLPIIYYHCKYSFNNPSKHSSANNHLISEYSGLYIACSKWKFKESNKWKEYAKLGLETEIEKQHCNGVNKEEAAEYIQFITDFFLIPYVIGNKNNDHFSEKYKICIREILKYIYSFTDVKINFPKYGDEDDGYVLNFSEISHFNNFKSLLISASIMFNDSSFLKENFDFDVKNQLLFYDVGQKVFEQLNTNENKELGSKFYTKAGHFIFRKIDNNKEIYAHLDIAPLGYLSIAAHGHSDVLSFLIHINGHPFFVDSGTYSYHTEKKWRNYFVSSKAHNTITIDNKNQAFHASDTMWLNHFKPEVISFIKENNIERVIGSYNNSSKVKHIRSFEFDRNLNQFLIEDKIIINDDMEHHLFIPFHLHPKIQIEKCTTSVYNLSNNLGTKINLSLDNKLKWNVIKGALEPILGWYSESFMRKEPTSVIFSEIKVKESLSIFTKIKISEY